MADYYKKVKKKLRRPEIANAGIRKYEENEEELRI